MRFKGLLLSIATAALLSLAMPAAADQTMPYHGLSEQERQEVRERWSSMTPEERAEVRRQSDEYWAGLSDEERAAKREELRKQRSKGSHGAMTRGEWQAMTPEERQAHREEMRKRWEAMTPEERRANPGMMRSPHSAQPKEGEGEPKGQKKDNRKD